MSPMSEFIQHLRRTMVVRDDADLTDEQLLDNYISRRDEAALAILVERHGPMVWGVCRRLLCNYHDAEDAFQATFLVFVRKAASIASRELLANWLYGVAHQTALKARATAAKRRARERQVTQMPEPAGKEQDLWPDLQPLLDGELSRLPDKYRAVIVLCDLEGKTRKEAARQLSVPEGTIASRLAKAREMLAERLTRHGLAVSGATVAAILSPKVSATGVPALVVSTTIKAAILFAASEGSATGVISTPVVVLTEGVLRTMLFTKLKIATLVLFGIAVAGVSTGRWLFAVKATEPMAERQEEKKENTPTPRPNKAESDKQKIQGTWRMVVDEAEKQKQLFPVAEYKSSLFIVKGEQFVWELKSKKVKGTIRLDEKAKTFLLIYEGDGLEGTYRIDGSVELTAKLGYARNKVLPGLPPNPIVLERVSSGERELKEAVEELNRKADNGYFDRAIMRQPSLGKEQRPKPATVDEVVSAIRGWNRKEPPIPDSTYRIFQQIADSKLLPPGASLYFRDEWRHPGGDDKYEYRVWRIQLDAMTGKNTGYGLVVREERLDRRIALLPAPGYSWLTSLNPAKPRGGFFDAHLIVAFEEDKQGALLITVGRATPKKGALDMRVVAFDSEGNRYLAARQIWGGVNPDITMLRFRLDAKKLPVAKVKYVGIEGIEEANLKVASEAAVKQAREKGIELLPLPEVGKPYEFSVTTSDGKTIASRNLRVKVVLIDCWASWCGPCLREMTEVKKLYEDWHDKGLEVIGISLDKDTKAAAAAAKKYALPWPQIVVPAGEEARQLWSQASRIESIPRLLVVDRKGILRADKTSARDVEKIVADLVTGGPSPGESK